jgi:hypothetical protein
MQPLQTLSLIPGVKLIVELTGGIGRLDHPCIAQWLKQHGQLISHLNIQLYISEDRLKLRDFCEEAAPCRSMDLTICHRSGQVVDLTDLDPVAGSLLSLACSTCNLRCGSVTGVSALSNMSQLTALQLEDEDVMAEEPWGFLTSLRSLQQLMLEVGAGGDPSPLSALTGLTSLHLLSRRRLEAGDPTPFMFSSLQPLSTLQRLKVLHLGGYACGVTSLQGLAGLRNLTQLKLEDTRWLKTLEGIGPGVIEFSIAIAPDLVRLAGIEGCTSLEKLSLLDCGVCSLHPLMGLTSMRHLKVHGGKITSLEGLNSMSMQSLSLTHCRSLTHLSGVEHFSALKSLEVEQCGLNSLQPLSQLGEAFQRLRVYHCKGVQEKVLEFPHVQRLDVHVFWSNVKKVVLGGLDEVWF